MKLEDQMCSLELAKKLKELGVVQESLYWWSEHTNPPRLWGFEELAEAIPDFGNEALEFAAFTVAELGELLPGNVGGLYFVHQWGFMHNRAYTTAKEMVGNGVVVEFDEDTEANARAKMLIYLLENKLITLPQ